MNSHTPRPLCAARPLALPFLLVTAMSAACANQEEIALQVPSDTDAAELTGAAATTAQRSYIPFTALSDDIGAAGQTESRRVLTSNTAYRSLFGHDAPAAVDWSAEWVFFYSAGQQTSGGYSTELRSVGRDGGDISFVTSLLSPGKACVTTASLTRPYLLARFPRQTGALSVHYFRADRVQDCTVDPCATVRCAAGYRCQAKQVVCIKEPCDPVAECVPNVEVSCGGFAGRACPGAGLCVDDPRDSCRPEAGGRDCSGLCECAPAAVCRTGHWDSSPSVCACVP